MSSAVAYFGAFVALGMTMAALGPTLPGLAQQTRSTIAQISVLLSARSLGYLLGALLGGRLFDRLPGHAVLAGVLLLLAAALAAVPLIPMLWLLTCVVLVFGALAGMVEVGANALMQWSYRADAGPLLNALHFFFGVGAFLMPILVAQAALLSGDIAWAYWLCGLLILPVAVWLARLPSPPRQVSAAMPGAGPTVDYRLVGLVAVFFFLYAGIEHSFGDWIAAYSAALGLSSGAKAAYLASAFWASITVGRLVATALTTRLRSSALVTAGLAGSAVAVGIIVVWPASAAALWVGVVVLGLSLAPVVPCTLALVGECMAVTGLATGWFFVGLGAGGMTIPWLIGQFFEGVGPVALMVTMAVVLALACAVWAGLARRMGRSRPSLAAS
jgi:FHS family Na+ dependent glucose MFS transporter 1